MAKKRVRSRNLSEIALSEDEQRWGQHPRGSSEAERGGSPSVSGASQRCLKSRRTEKCHECGKRDVGGAMARCITCGDSVHLSCRPPPAHGTASSSWECPSCALDCLACSECARTDDDAQMLLCDGPGCARAFHLFCLRPILVAVPRGAWLCPVCTRSNEDQSTLVPGFPLVQTKITAFFRIVKTARRLPGLKLGSARGRRRALTLQKRRRVLQLHRPSACPSARLRQMASLATALTAAGLAFTADLVYAPGLAPRSANRTQLEAGGMQPLERESRRTYEQFRELCRAGFHPPLRVLHDPEQGWVVEAAEAIRDWTLVTEYAGEVDFMHARRDDRGDGLLELLHAESARAALVVCPDRRANVARFISGINNHASDGRRKINLRCIRFDIDGEAHALLVAIRDIKRGERLYYDYNGLFHSYPTEHFT